MKKRGEGMKPRLCVMNLFLSAFLLYCIVTYHTNISIIWMGLLEHIVYRRITRLLWAIPHMSVLVWTISVVIISVLDVLNL